MVTVVTVMTAFLCWRCCWFLSSDCSICEVNIHRNAGASQKLLIWEGGLGGLTLKLCIICVEFKNYIIQLYRLYHCNIGQFAAPFM